MKKKLIGIVAAVLAICCIICGTVAFITAQTAPVKNTFTAGNITIDLDETKTDFKMIPGNTIDKDPIITVEKDSEACWLFVKVDESDNLSSFITYSLASGWTQLKTAQGADVKGVFYREVAATTADLPFHVLANDRVTVKNTVTKAMLDALTEATQPTLTFTAYAVQKANVANALTAWAQFAS